LSPELLTRITLISQMNADYLFSELTEKIIASAFQVHKVLGAGFLESVYVRALLVELQSIGFAADTEVPITVHYRDQVVGEFRADLLIEREIIVEVKALASVAAIHEAQLVNYLNATGKSVGLLLNFGSSVQVRRKINSNNLRQSAKSA
jgi:GxxExxY protein